MGGLSQSCFLAPPKNDDQPFSWIPAKRKLEQLTSCNTLSYPVSADGNVPTGDLHGPPPLRPLALAHTVPCVGHARAGRSSQLSSAGQRRHPDPAIVVHAKQRPLSDNRMVELRQRHHRAG